MLEVTCGWAGNTCTGCVPTTDGALGFTATLIVTGLLQFVASNCTVGGVLEVAAVKRASAEETSVLPSVRTLIVTEAPSGCSTSTPPESPSMTSTFTGGLSTTPALYVPPVPSELDTEAVIVDS